MLLTRRDFVKHATAASAAAPGIVHARASGPVQTKETVNPVLGEAPDLISGLQACRRRIDAWLGPTVSSARWPCWIRRIA